MTALKLDMHIMQKEKKKTQCDTDSKLTLGDKADDSP